MRITKNAEVFTGRTDKFYEQARECLLEEMQYWVNSPYRKSIDIKDCHLAYTCDLIILWSHGKHSLKSKPETYVTMMQMGENRMETYILDGWIDRPIDLYWMNPQEIYTYVKKNSRHTQE